MKDFSKLNDTEHMLQWLADQPYEEIFGEVQGMLAQQVPGSVLESFVVTSEPQWLTGARKSEDEEEKVILVRTGLAFEFELAVHGNGQLHELSGVFSWAAGAMDEPENRHHRCWLDIGGTLDEFGASGALKERVQSM